VCEGEARKGVVSPLGFSVGPSIGGGDLAAEKNLEGGRGSYFRKTGKHAWIQEERKDRQKRKLQDREKPKGMTRTDSFLTRSSRNNKLGKRADLRTSREKGENELQDIQEREFCSLWNRGQKRLLSRRGEESRCRERNDAARSITKQRRGLW